MLEVPGDLLGALPLEQLGQRLDGPLPIQLENEELLTHQGLEVGHGELGLQLRVGRPQTLEVALVGGGRPAQHIDEGANDRLVATALGDALPQLRLAPLDEATMLRLGAGTAAMHVGVTAQAHQGLQQRLAVDIQEEALGGAVAQVAPGVQGAGDLAGGDGLQHPEEVVLVQSVAVPANLLGQHRDGGHQRVAVGEEAIAQAIGMHAAHPVGRLGGGHGAQPGLHEEPVEPQVDLRDPRHGGEAGVILGIVLDHPVELLDGAGLELQQVVALDQLGVVSLDRLGNGGLIEARGQHIDVVHVGGELGVLLAGDAARDEDPQVAGAVMDAVDDGLLVGDYVLGALVEVAHPAQRLGRRRDVVAPGAEHHHRGAHVAQVDTTTVGGDHLGGGEAIADEEVVNDVLDLLAAQHHMAAPPAFELQVALRLGIDVGVEAVLLGPVGVGRVEVLEVLHQPGTVELAGTQVAEQGGHPAAAGHAAGVTHGRLAAHAGPVGERRAGDQDGAEQVGLQGGRHHDLPARLAVAHYHGLLGVALGVALVDQAQEGDLRLHHVLDGLPGLGIGQEADEVAGVAGTQGHPDLAVGLEAADARAVAGAGVDHHEGAHLGIGGIALRGQDPQQLIVDRPRQLAAIHQHLGIEAQHAGAGLFDMFQILVAANAHHVQIEHAALEGVQPVAAGGSAEPEGVQQGQRSGRGSRHGKVHCELLALRSGEEVGRCRVVMATFAAMQYNAV